METRKSSSLIAAEMRQRCVAMTKQQNICHWGLHNAGVRCITQFMSERTVRTKVIHHVLFKQHMTLAIALLIWCFMPQWLVHHLGPDWNISTKMAGSAMNFGTVSHALITMNWNSGDLLVFHNQVNICISTRVWVAIKESTKQIPLLSCLTASYRW